MPWMEFAPDITYPAGAGINLGDGLDLKQIEYLPRRRGDKPMVDFLPVLKHRDSDIIVVPVVRGH